VTFNASVAFAGPAQDALGSTEGLFNILACWLENVFEGPLGARHIMYMPVTVGPAADAQPVPWLWRRGGR